MLFSKNPVREMDVSEVRGRARYKPFDTSRRSLLGYDARARAREFSWDRCVDSFLVVVGGAAIVAAFGLPIRSLAYQSSPASGAALQGNNQGDNNTRVQISCLTRFATLKTLGIAQL